MVKSCYPPGQVFRFAWSRADVTEPEPLATDHQLWTHPLVRLTPHISSNYTLLRGVLFDKVIANLERFVRGEAWADIVDPVAGY